MSLPSNDPGATTSPEEPVSSVPLEHIPFPSTHGEERLRESQSTSSNLTSSDKLTALPSQSSPIYERMRTPTNRAIRRSMDPTGSLTSLDSASDSLRLQSLPGPIRQSESDSSVGRETPRLGNESERSLPAPAPGRQPFAGRLNYSDSVVGSPSLRSRDNSVRGQALKQSPPPSNRGTGRGSSTSGRPQGQGHTLSPVHAKESFATPPSRSPAQSRAASPLRILQGWNFSRTQSRDEPFVLTDPFNSHIPWFGIGRREHSPSARPSSEPKANLVCGPLSFPCPCSCGPRKRKDDDDGPITTARKGPQWTLYVNHTILFCSYILPRRLYLYWLLHLPALYWQRVARIFEDAEVSRHEVQRLIDACGDMTTASTVDAALASGYATPSRGTHRALSLGIPFPEEWEPPVVSPALARFKTSWEQFIDSLLREWKTLNLVSALLLATILTIFQVEDAANDPLTRWASLLSLVFAIWSLCYGCVYIVQFNTMRSMDKASRWAEEAQRTRAAVFWNIWVLLATPAVWLAWSMISFCVAILSYVWRAGDADQIDGRAPLTPGQALAPRVVISAVFALGLFNFCMVIRTFGRYTNVSVRRDRRSRFGRGDRDNERGRSRGRNEDRDRLHGRVVGQQLRDAVGGIGLGLSGLEVDAGSKAGSKQGSPALKGGVIVENVDLEKGEAVFLAGDRLGAGQLTRASPRVSPKL